MAYPTEISIDDFYYNEQFRKHIVQFMAIFSTLKVSTGKNDNNSSSNLIEVPITYGSRDRVVDGVLSDNTQNKLLKLPAMAAQVTGITIARDRLVGQGTERRQVKLKRGGTIPDDLQQFTTLKPVPYEIEMELSILVTNTNHHFQILEQILLLFNPSISIQMSDSYGDQSSKSEIFLQSIGIEENYPAGEDRRIIASSIIFSFVTHLSAPVDLRNEIIKQINIRVGAAFNTADINFENLDPIVIDTSGYIPD